MASSTTSSMDQMCVFCSEPLRNGKTTVQVTPRGIPRIIDAKQERGSNIEIKAGDTVHTDCRADFINKKSISRDKKHKAAAAKEISDQRLRSTSSSFNFKNDCLYCGQPAFSTTKRKEFENTVHQVTTLETRKMLLDICKNRGDEWASEVKRRIEWTTDLPASDACYHHVCSINFRTNKGKPQQFKPAPQQTKKKVRLSGRPIDATKILAFEKVIEYFEANDDEQISVGDLVGKMEEYLQGTGCEAYVVSYMKDRLRTHFGDKIVITSLNGKADVVTFRDKAGTILHDFWKDKRKENDNKEILRLAETVGKLIRAEIKERPIDNTCYPLSKDLSDITSALNYLPESLKLLLNTILSGKDKDLKVASLGQAIMQGARPRVLLTPLGFGLGVQMYHHFGSRFLIDTLHGHGFCPGYSVVKGFSRSAAVVQGTDLYSFAPGQFIQYSADNADHNTRTLDGKGTFHGMGIIAASTPGGNTTQPPVPRGSVTNTQILNAARIDIKYYTKPLKGLCNMKFERLRNMQIPDPISSFNILWNSSLLFGVRPNWNGFMQMVQKGEHHGPASVTFLPMIDMDPSDLSCIYSTLNFVENQARQYGFSPVLTFDQPLYWKALQISFSEDDNSPLRSIVLRLGGLHTEMSFLGAIGTIMNGSGLEDLLELIYAKNTVPHILSGKAISRAVRGHLIIDAALNILLLSQAYNIPLQVTEQTVQINIPLPQEIQSAKELMDRLVSSDYTMTPQDEQNLSEILEKIETLKVSLKENSTAQLWLQYKDQVAILKKFIGSERMGNWLCHLSSSYEMLDHLAAAGHNNYTKSLHLYLQLMDKLPQSHPEVYQSFLEGFHAVRRSNRYWAGLSTDLIIEQMLMRSMKSTGGLTRGRGLSEIQRAVWLLSMPACAEVNANMQELTGVSHKTSEQHQETSKTRQARDAKDTIKILANLIGRNPFDADQTVLHNIMNGVAADSTVNAHDAKRVGANILEKMEGNSVETFTFRKKDQVICMGSRSSVKIGDETVVVDPQLLFQRLLATAPTTDNLEDVFRYELCSFPASLFESSILPRKADKANLSEAIWKKTEEVNTTEPGGDLAYVLDGGSLLHRIPWKDAKTYDDICSRYINHIDTTYKESLVTIVFDGYSAGPSTKDVTHLRRTRAIGPDVTFEGEMSFNLKKDDFLSNPRNKERFIKYLGSKLQHAGRRVLYAKADADVLIVKTAIESAENNDTVLVGEDADLLVLLLYHTPDAGYKVYFSPQVKSQKKSPKMWDIKQTKQKLDEKTEICGNILFLHAFLGCDTTSKIQGHGKGQSLTKIENATFRRCAEVFQADNSSKEDIIKAGEQAMVIICGGRATEQLDTLRYNKFRAKSATAHVAVQVNSLPPTSAAATYHSLRVYYQIQEWKDNLDGMHSTEWGWTLKEDRLVPVLSDKPAAPSALLELVRCGCKGDCATRRCTCKKHGIDCSPMCTECKGVTCQNSAVIEELESEEECEEE